MMGKVRVAAALLLALGACLLALPASTTANKISINWKPNVNYSDWLEQHRPSTRATGSADVVQVDEAGYNKCDSSHAIYNYSKGRNFAFELNETKTYYFICSYGYCYGGMRLAIKAEKQPPPSPPPSGNRSGAFARAHAPVLFAAVAVLAALLRMV
ncbi:hypothetical protein PR202_gb10885 [Eleusine coracana subsp. coracana]|uniref:Phytocyanin domain-containing protein n=1 Tax=Eleusine coracana subsp. coracana TaxID=191504 RepID=A0AAV5EM25_ELECO|nr:hypothetical protein PR202_gb10885 [Eleusine coracana subsp. coracana]